MPPAPTAPPPVVDVLYKYRNETRLADIVGVPMVAAVTNVGQPSDADLEKFYDAHKDLFRAPNIARLHAGRPDAPTT